MSLPENYMRGIFRHYNQGDKPSSHIIMKLGLIQLEATQDIDTNVDNAIHYIREAAANGADLVLLPEVWNVGYFAFDEYDTCAEPIDGPTATRLGDLAAELGILLHAGSIIESDGNDLYNTSILFDTNGERVATYRKIHLFGYESEESQLLSAGEDIVTVDTSIGTMGMTTCYDLRFPELYRAMCDEGAELFLITSAWPQQRLDHWRLLTQARAVEEQVFLAAANLTGKNRGIELGGNSLVVDPWGIRRTNAGSDEGVTITEIDLAKVEKIRNEFPALEDRQINLQYGK